jgi:osmotically-inducible protein OsmY
MKGSQRIDCPRIGLIGIALLCASLSACAAYKACGFEGCAGDKQTTAAVQNVIRQYPALEAPNTVRVQTLDHIVYLYGQVNTELERQTAQEAALSVNGVKRVVNSISLQFEGR